MSVEAGSLVNSEWIWKLYDRGGSQEGDIAIWSAKGLEAKLLNRNYKDADTGTRAVDTVVTHGLRQGATYTANACEKGKLKDTAAVKDDGETARRRKIVHSATSKVKGDSMFGCVCVVHRASETPEEPSLMQSKAEGRRKKQWPDAQSSRGQRNGTRGDFSAEEKKSEM